MRFDGKRFMGSMLLGFRDGLALIGAMALAHQWFGWFDAVCR